MTQDAAVTDPQARIKMRHPDLNDSLTETSEEAFTSLWEAKGWQRVTDEQAVALVVSDGQVDDLSGLTVPQLQEIADAEQVSYDGSTRKADLVAAIVAKRETTTS